jgi:hybrid cluster-associated redox disulfide protein
MTAKKTIKKKAVKSKAIKKPAKKKFEITKNMTFMQLLEKKPESVNTLFEAGLHCIGCHMSAYETIEQGCQAHGMNKKEIDELIKKLNEAS